MRPWHSLMLAAALLACGGDKDDNDAPTGPGVDGDADTDADTDSDTDTDTDVDCYSEIVGVTPEPNAQNVVLDTTVVVDFDTPVPAGGAWSIEVPNALGTATLAPDGLSATWTPEGDLSPETTYTINASVCDDDESSVFTTAPPPVDPAAIEGTAYGLAWADPVTGVTITEPAAGDLLKGLMPIDFVLLHLASIDPVTDEIDAAATLAYYDSYSNVVPDCDVAVQEIADFSRNPFFSFGPQNIQFEDGATAYDIEDMILFAEVSQDGTQLLNPRLSGLVATEQFIPGEDCLTGPLVQLFQPTCRPCTISTTGQCMLVEGNAPAANIQPGIDLYGTCGL